MAGRSELSKGDNDGRFNGGVSGLDKTCRWIVIHYSLIQFMLMRMIFIMKGVRFCISYLAYNFFHITNYSPRYESVN